HFESIDVEARHEVRIALKKLRYGTEYFAGLFDGKDTAPYLSAASKMQDHLGHLNDVAVAERLVGELVKAAKAGPERVKAAQGGGIVVGWYAHLLASTEVQTVADWRSFAKRQPFWRRGKSGQGQAAKGKA
ncbi:MAG: CHAD domain-containing protein, partial [Pseudomonadota bacterium]